MSTAKALAAKLETERPKCRVCGMDIKRGPDLCVACEQGYESMRADVVAWLTHGRPWIDAEVAIVAERIERGDADGFAAKAKEQAT